MNAKRLIMSFGMLAFVGAVVVGGTGAFFSDEITSEGNVFTAGSVTLGIANMFHEYNGDGEGADQPEYEDDGFSFELSDVKPGDTGEVTYRLENGANAAHVCAMVEETNSFENGINGPESDAGDTTNGPGNAELGNYLSFNFGGNSGTLADISGVWQEVGPVDANDMTDSSVEYCFGDFNGGNCDVDLNTNYNDAQTDSLTADVSFYAVQTRNNENFSCASLNEDGEGDDRPLVGADLTTYSEPVAENCDVTVENDESINSLASDVAEDSLVCVDGSTYTGEGDAETITLSITGLTLASINGAADISEKILVTADDVTVTGFELDSMEVNEADNVTVSYNTFDGTANRALLTGAPAMSGLTVTNNVFNGYDDSTLGSAVMLEGQTSNSQVEYNDFIGNNVAFTDLAETGSPSVGEGNVVTRNHFENNTAIDAADGDDVTITQNNILNAVMENYEVNGSTNVMVATNNYWGSDDGAASTVGNVDFTPEETTAYPQN